MRRQNDDKGIISGIWIACSMYSRIPVPSVEWSGAGMRYALCFFPLVGVVIGLAVAGFAWLAGQLELNLPAFCCVGTVIPLVITGGIHMDGFLDTVDARSSFQSRERKLEILKDPHAGAFAICGCGIYLLLYVAVFSQLRREAAAAAGAVYVLSRAFSGWSVVSFPKARKDGLASAFSTQAEKRVVQAAMAAWAAAAVCWLLATGGVAAAVAVAVAALGTCLWYYRMAMKEFGGMTGDLAGYFLQVAELVMLFVLVCATGAAR